MKIVLQRVKKASVKINEEVYSKIEEGFLILLGIQESDNKSNLEWLCKKVAKLRVFEDKSNKMNLSVSDIKGSILVVPNFTLYANSEKGNRPSFIDAAKPELAEPLFHNFCKELAEKYELDVRMGKFGADMEVELTNNGPVTIILEK